MAGKLAPLEADEPLVRLDVPGHRTSWLSLPLCTTTRRPVVLAAHGTGGSAFAMCEDVRKMVGDRAFVLCLRGEQLPHGGETFADLDAFKRELEAALSALERAHPHRVDAQRPLVVGSSLGANLARIAAIHEPGRFPRAIFVEGGNRGWSAATSRAFRQGGGRRILFGCGTASCLEGAAEAEALLRSAELDVRLVSDPRAGHSFRALRNTVTVELEWLLADDPRFSVPAP